MRTALLAVGLCVCNSGCGLMTNFARNVVVQPAQAVDDCRSRAQNDALALAAWRDLVAKKAEESYSIHYARGFKEGFADFLYAGGKGNPPPVPPWYYMTIFYQTPEGNAAVQDWFTGFRHGATLAQSSGMRHFITVPLSAPNLGPNPDQFERVRSRSNAPDTKDVPTLPMPKPVSRSGSGIRNQESAIQNQGSRHNIGESGVQDQGSRHNSWTETTEMRSDLDPDA